MSSQTDELEQEIDGEPADNELTCGDCGEEFSSKLLLGAHRYHKHGIKGSGGHKSKAPKRGRPVGGGVPGGKDNVGGGESGRQARRRKAVRETLTELVSFTDEARGRGEGKPADLADVIRRDADKIANSVAWIAERATPVGRLIDLAFGHGGLLTVLRGFMGVGTWTLAHWRQLIEQRERVEQEQAGVSAEELDELMQNEYGPPDRSHVT